MAKKPDIVTVSSGYYSTDVMNANFTELRDAFDNTLSLDGSTPNAMNADLDLNNNDLLNVGTLNVQDFSVDGGSIDGYLTEAEAARDEAEASATAAASSETNAATSETNAANTQTTIEGLLASVNTTFGDDLIEYNGDVDDNTLAGGTYRVTGTATGDKYESAYNMLVLHRSNDDQIVQVAFLGTGIAVRGYSNPTWSDWEEMTTKTYVDTAVAGAASTTSGTETPLLSSFSGFIPGTETLSCSYKTIAGFRSFYTVNFNMDSTDPVSTGDRITLSDVWSDAVPSTYLYAHVGTFSIFERNSVSLQVPSNIATGVVTIAYGNGVRLTHLTVTEVIGSPTWDMSGEAVLTLSA